MKSTVYTETTCDLCGVVERREGAEEFVPPVGWAELNVAKRLDGEGWSNADRWEYTLCSKCNERLMKWLKENETHQP